MLTIFCEQATAKTRASISAAISTEAIEQQGITDLNSLRKIYSQSMAGSSHTRAHSASKWVGLGRRQLHVIVAWARKSGGSRERAERIVDMEQSEIVKGNAEVLYATAYELTIMLPNLALALLLRRHSYISHYPVACSSSHPTISTFEKLWCACLFHSTSEKQPKAVSRTSWHWKHRSKLQVV